MADTKRQSFAGKIATPKVGPAKDGIDAGDAILYKAVGARYVLMSTLLSCAVTDAGLA